MCLLYMDKELLQRYVEGNATADERSAVVNWLDSDQANVREFMALHKLYDITVLNKKAYDKLLTKKKTVIPFRRITYEFMKIAAIFLILWFGIRSIYEKPISERPEAQQMLFVPAGQRAELTLPDGTVVWLNAKSKIIYPSNFEKGNREIELDGEAYFKVTPDKTRQFIVKTGSMDICVLGTEFNVIAYKDHPVREVSLLEGSVLINASELLKPYRMTENEQINLNNGKLHTSQIADHEYFKWKEGLLCFRNETVKDIIEKLQLYYDIKIDVKKTDLLKYHYSGKFRTKDGVEQVIKVLQLEHQFTYVKDNELNLITIK